MGSPPSRSRRHERLGVRKQGLRTQPVARGGMCGEVPYLGILVVAAFGRGPWPRTEAAPQAEPAGHACYSGRPV